MIDLNQLVEAPLMQALAWTLVHFVWQGAVLGFCAFLVLRVVRPTRASTRYAVGVTTLALMLLSSIATLVLLAQSSATHDNLVALEVAPASTPQSSGVTGWVIADLSASPTARSLLAAPGESNPLCVQPLGPLSLFVIVTTWITGVLALSFRLLGGWIVTRRLAREAVDAVSPSIAAAAEDIATRLRVTRAVAILQSGAVAVPTLIGWAKPVVLLPAAALAGLSPAQLQAILAHELAHVRRHDYLINLLQSVVETLLFYHPATWWVSARVREEREHCCDDLAVDVCGDRLVYVSALAELTALAAHPGFALAATDGSLASRVRRLLGGQRSTHEAPPAWTALALFALLVVSAGTFGTASVQEPRRTDDIVLAADQQPPSQPPVAPVPPAESLAPVPPVPFEWESLPSVAVPPVPPSPPAPPAPPATPHPPARRGDDLQVPAPPAPPAPPATPASPTPAAPPPPPAPPMPPTPGTGSSGNFTWSDENRKVSFKWTGPFRLSDDERDIAWIEEGATLTISDGLIFADRLDLKGLSGGRIERTFSRNGFKREYEPEGRLFLATAIDTIIRRSGMFARDRVARFLKQGGPDAVLAEVDRLAASSYVKRVYLTELMKQATLSDAVISRVLQRVATDITGDYDRSMVLTSIAQLPGLSDAHRVTVARAAKAIGSDYEQRRALSAVIAAAPVAPAVATAVVDAATTVQSSYERSVILSELARKGGVTGGTAPAFMAVVRSMPSSYEQRRVLAVVAAQPALGDAVTVEAVRATSTMASAHEQSLTLLALIERGGVTDASADTFFAAVGTIKSAFERARVLRAVTSRGSLSERVLIGVLQAAADLTSAEYRLQLLMDVAGRYPLQGRTRDLYIAAARGIASQAYEDRALAALVRAERR